MVVHYFELDGDDWGHAYYYVCCNPRIIPRLMNFTQDVKSVTCMNCLKQLR